MLIPVITIVVITHCYSLSYKFSIYASNGKLCIAMKWLQAFLFFCQCPKVELS